MEQVGLATTNSAVEQVDTSEMDGKYLAFWTDQQLYGVPIADVVQIVGMQAIVEMPEYPDYAKGVINLRGTIIPVIDMRMRLKKSPKDYEERTCIIVTSIQNTQVGFIVDGVDAVTDLNQISISPPPKLSGEQTDMFITGIANLEDKVILLLDTIKLLQCSEDLQKLLT